MRLIVGDASHSVSQVGPNFVILEEGIELSPCETDFLMTVDGCEFWSKLSLFEGAVPFEKRVATRILQAPPGDTLEAVLRGDSRARRQDAAAVPRAS